MDESKREEARALIEEAREAADYWKYHRKLGTATLIERMADVLDILLTAPADPTDDEREALAAVIHRRFNLARGRGGVAPLALADQIVAAGFRRPTPATREEIAEVLARNQARMNNAAVLWDGPELLTDALLSRFTVTKKH